MGRAADDSKRVKRLKKVPRENNGLFYTDSEIVSMYINTRNKIEQLTVLSQLNLCSVEKIISVLKNAGINVELPEDALVEETA